MIILQTMIEIEVGMGENGTIVLMIGAMTATTVDHLAKALVTVGQDLAWVGNMSMALLLPVGNGFLRINTDHTIEMTIGLQQGIPHGVDGQHFQMT